MAKKNRTIAIMLVLVFTILYLAVACYMSSYVAGCFYYLIHKTLPHGVDIHTWWRYWDAYGEDPRERKKLQGSAALAVVLFFVLPIVIFLSIRNAGRKLHGDARFASAAEIRETGLL